MEIQRIEVWRVQFGADSKSNESVLIAVERTDYLPFAIDARQKQLVKFGSNIDASVVEIQKLEMTPTLYTK